MIRTISEKDSMYVGGGRNPKVDRFLNKSKELLQSTKHGLGRAAIGLGSFFTKIGERIEGSANRVDRKDQDTGTEL